MLSRQTRRAVFTGGLDSRRLTDWHVSQLATVKPDRMYFAYDHPSGLEPLIEAGCKLKNAGFTDHHLACYVLIGQDNDTLSAAEARLREAWAAGVMPYAMLWSDGKTTHDADWHKLQRQYTRPAITRRLLGGRGGEE